MNTRITGFAIATFALVLVASCSSDDKSTPTQPAKPQTAVTKSAAAVDQERTPFQLSMMESIAERQSDGLPVAADVSYEYTSSAGVPLSTIQQQGMSPGEQITIVATTIIRYDNPEQAGVDKWPAFVVTNNNTSDDQGFVKEGDYSQLVKDKLQERIPDIWDRYEFGYEPRTYTITEEYKIRFPEPANNNLVPGVTNSTSTESDEIVTGLTIEGPEIDETIKFDVVVLGETVLDFIAGFQLDWTVGMRLPMEVSITSTDPVNEGDTFVPTSVADGVNWSASDFTAAGVSPESGNEYVMQFKFLLGVFLEILGADIIDLGPNIDIDKTKSFTTPFGPGATVTLPSVDIELWGKDAGIASVSVGFAASPEFGSGKFTADWAASGEGSGSGGLTYTNPAIAENLASVFAIDGPGSADVDVDEFQYFFTKFLIDLALFLDLEAEIPGPNLEKRFTVPVTDFDLSALTGKTYLDVHDDSTPTSVGHSVTILNVPPTAMIDETGTTMVNGVPTFLLHAGDPMTFTGTSADPGRDDLTLSWDWDDGAPSPDVSTTYPVPYNVSEDQMHTFGDACVYMVGFKSVDDDGAFGDDHVAVVVTPSPAMANRARLEGYWQHQLRGNGNPDFDMATLGCYLDIVGHMSAVFSEARDASTIEMALDVLHLQMNADSFIEQLDRELLVAWLNFANGAVHYTEMLDTDEDGIGDTQFVDVMAAAEAVRLNPGSTDAEIEAQTEIMHLVNRMGVGSSASM